MNKKLSDRSIENDHHSSLNYNPSGLDLFLTGITLFVVLYIPIWILISTLYSIFDNDYISFFEFIIIQIFVISINGMLLLRTKFSSVYLYQSLTYKFSILTKKLLNISIIQSERESEEFNLIGFGKIKPCCYNAARLEDRYCMCGKVISDDLFNFVHEN